MYCQNCGIENESNAEYCKSCGQPLNVTQDVQPSKNKKKIPKALIWIPLATVFLVAIGVFGYRHFTGGRQTFKPCTVIIYDEDGEITWKETWNKYGEAVICGDGEKTYYECKYDYDNKGRTTREEYWSDNKMYFYSVYEYTGNTRDGKQYNENGDMTGTSEATLNDKGLPTRIASYDDEGNKRQTLTYEYDDYGYITKMVIEFFEDGNRNLKRTVVREYTYKNGRPVDATNTITEVFDENYVTTDQTLWEFVY